MLKLVGRSRKLKRLPVAIKYVLNHSNVGITLLDYSDLIYLIQQIWQCNSGKTDVFCIIRFVESDFLKSQASSKLKPT